MRKPFAVASSGEGIAMTRQAALVRSGGSRSGTREWGSLDIAPIRQ